MSGVSREAVFAVGDTLLFDCDGKAPTDDVVHANRINAKETQVRKALHALEENGFIRYKRDGRKAYWIVEDRESLTTYLGSDDFQQDFNSYEEKLAWCRENL